MKNSTFFYLIATSILAISASSCSVIGGIFKTGMGVGVFLAVAIVVFIVVLIIKSGKRYD